MRGESASDSFLSLDSLGARMTCIVVVEDNQLVCDELVVRLQLEGYDTVGVDCGIDLDEVLLQRNVGIMIVDLNLPHEDGLSIIQRVRNTRPHIRIIILTARITPSDRELGYMTGADIYMPKPVRIKELLAAIGALYRRLEESDKSSQGIWRLDSHRLILFSGSNEMIQMSHTEVQILCYMATRPDQTASSDQLLELLDLPLSEEGKNRLMVKISRLRKKICSNGVERQSIRTIRQTGYRLCFNLQVLPLNGDTANS